MAQGVVAFFGGLDSLRIFGTMWIGYNSKEPLSRKKDGKKPPSQLGVIAMSPAALKDLYCASEERSYEKENKELIRNNNHPKHSIYRANVEVEIISAFVVVIDYRRSRNFSVKNIV